MPKKKKFKDMTTEELQKAVDTLNKAQSKHGWDEDRQKKINRFQEELEKR